MRDHGGSLLGILILVTVCITAIIAYGTYRCQSPEFTDPLTKSVLPEPWNRYVDGWGLTHLFFFMLLGYIFPAYWALLAFLGVLWELVEYSSESRPWYVQKCHDDISKEKQSNWWYGRWEDIVMNVIGLALGVALRTAGAPRYLVPVIAVSVIAFQVVLVSSPTIGQDD